MIQKYEKKCLTQFCTHTHTDKSTNKIIPSHDMKLKKKNSHTQKKTWNLNVDAST